MQDLCATEALPLPLGACRKEILKAHRADSSQRMLSFQKAYVAVFSMLLKIHKTAVVVDNLDLADGLSLSVLTSVCRSRASTSRIYSKRSVQLSSGSIVIASASRALECRSLEPRPSSFAVVPVAATPDMTTIHVGRLTLDSVGHIVLSHLGCETIDPMLLALIAGATSRLSILSRHSTDRSSKPRTRLCRPLVWAAPTSP